MKRMEWALLFAVAWMLVSGMAFAATDEAPLATAVGNHVWLTLIAGFLPPVIKALNEGTLNVKTLPARFRLLLIGVLSAIATSIEMVVNGGSWANAITAFAVAAGPSLLIEAVHAKWGGWKDATVTQAVQSDGSAGVKIISVPPPRNSVNPPPLAVMLIVTTLLALYVCACAAVCPTIKLASDVCPLIMVELPDGTFEAVPKEQIAAVAAQTRAARLSAKGSADAGADR
jgi:hypothetical protein